MFVPQEYERGVWPNDSSNKERRNSLIVDVCLVKMSSQPLRLVPSHMNVYWAVVSNQRCTVGLPKVHLQIIIEINQAGMFLTA